MLIQSISRTGEVAGEEQDQGRDFTEWAAEVRRLAEARNAVILAHNYQVPWVQDVADHVGDSLALSRLAAAQRRRSDRLLRGPLHGRDGKTAGPGPYGPVA